VVITNYDYRLRVAEQLWEIGAEAAILLEPDRRDSAAAVVGAAVAWTTAHDPKTVVAILAADHMFEDGKQFVTFGVTPDHPATGYGYMRERAKARALNYLPLLCKLRDSGETLHGVALQLTMMEIETPGKRKVWRDRTVAKMFEYAGERNPRPRSSGRTQADRRVAQPDFQTSAGALYRPHRPGLKRRAEAPTPPWTG
jgi:hypothetical protein